MNTCVMNLIDSTPINLEILFGKDAKHISDACIRVKNNWLYPYEGCYRADRQACKEWETMNSKQFKIIYGIAKRYGLYLRWHGNRNPCCGDQWEIYKNHVQIARIYC